MESRRSLRSKRRLTKLGDDVPMYPDERPCNDVERLISRLDLQSFAAASYARVDDAIVYALFASKRHPNGYRSLTPATALGSMGYGAQIVADSQAMEICHIWNKRISRERDFDIRAIDTTIKEITDTVAELFTPGDLPILKQ